MLTFLDNLVLSGTGAEMCCLPPTPTSRVFFQTSLLPIPFCLQQPLRLEPFQSWRKKQSTPREHPEGHMTKRMGLSWEKEWC